MNFDIESLATAADATFDVVVGQRDDGTKVGFRVVGTQSKQFRQAEIAGRAMSLRIRTEAGGPIDLRSEEGSMLAAQSEAKRQRLVVEACVVDIFGFTVGPTDPAAFGAETLKRILDAKPAWVSVIAEAIEDETNFTVG